MRSPRAMLPRAARHPAMAKWCSAAPTALRVRHRHEDPAAMVRVAQEPRARAALAPAVRAAAHPAAALADQSRAADLLNEQAPAVRRPDLLAILPARLFVPERPVTYVLVAWMLAIIPSLLLSALVNSMVPGQGPEIPAMPAGFTFFLLVLFAPIVETLIMGAVLLLLDRLFGFLPALLLSAAGWGLAHSFQAPAWGLVIWWPFLIFSLCFLVWKQRSLLLAFAVPAAVHALQNLVPTLLLVSGLEG